MMEKTKIVTINGMRYDAHTGLPLQNRQPTTPAAKALAAAGVHSVLQKSQTLVRRATKKPILTPASRPNRLPGRSMDIARSVKISRFAAHPVKVAPKVASKPDIQPAVHPTIGRLNKRHAAKQAPVATHVPLAAKDIKAAAITAALAKPVVIPAKKSFFKHHAHFINLFTIGAVIVILGAYFTYLNLPGWSVRVAAGQAGIDATYPEYRPDGYRLNGPVTYADGQVVIDFIANTGSNKFSLKQSKSTWDSSAVLDNIVRKDVGEKYITNQERGLTIYTYNGNAAWVNAGILYVIDGNAPLSSEQIRRIATSL
ncbi:MAG: hypothetical protein ABI716_02890 [Candidatus Saccharibacteria bacterium]